MDSNLCKSRFNLESTALHNTLYSCPARYLRGAAATGTHPTSSQWPGTIGCSHGRQNSSTSADSQTLHDDGSLAGTVKVLWKNALGGRRQSRVALPVKDLATLHSSITSAFPELNGQVRPHLYFTSWPAVFHIGMLAGARHKGALPSAGPCTNITRTRIHRFLPQEYVISNGSKLVDSDSAAQKLKPTDTLLVGTGPAAMASLPPAPGSAMRLGNTSTMKINLTTSSSGVHTATGTAPGSEGRFRPPAKASRVCAEQMPGGWGRRGEWYQAWRCRE